MSVRGAVAVGAALAALASSPALSGCTSAAGASDGRLQVVASTDVYGSVVRAVAGDRVDVTSIIAGTAQDPHSYEASARNLLAVSSADVVIENGGGYDDFMNRLRTTSAKAGAAVIDVVTISGITAPPGGELNEHVWYDFPAVATFVHRLVHVLSARAPAEARQFRAGAARFLAGVHRLERVEGAIRAADAGTPVAITEPVPLYLLQACGLVDRTPAAFSAALESDSDVSASVLQQTLDLFDHHEVRALVYNAQTFGAETTRVLAAAKADDVPAVPVTETLPAGIGYLAWMRANLTAVRNAVAR
jgi:zinc/manganese transport system substrate-binding protein